jgi:hypothetical protein
MPVVIEHLDAVAIFDRPGPLIDRSYMIAEAGLHARNVSDLKHAATTASAAHKRRNHHEAQRKARCWTPKRKQRCREKLHWMKSYYSAEE